MQTRNTTEPWRPEAQQLQYINRQYNYPTKNQGNNHRSEATEEGQLRINLNHRKPAANTGSEREEPKVNPKKKQVPGPSNGQRWE